MSLVRLKVVRADPAGNVTLFVLTPVDRALRADAAGKLIAALPEMKVEQVGFASAPLMGGAARLEMAGGEFCGNAARAWGMWTAREAGRVPPPERVRIEVSGCGHPIAVDVDWVEGTARTEMPLPLEVQPVPEFGGTLVHLGGIAHLVVRDTAPSREFFHRAEPAFVGLAGLEAYGVVFLECLDAAAGEGRLTPLVKVPRGDAVPGGQLRVRQPGRGGGGERGGPGRRIPQAVRPARRGPDRLGRPAVWGGAERLYRGAGLPGRAHRGRT